MDVSDIEARLEQLVGQLEVHEAERRRIVESLEETEGLAEELERYAEGMEPGPERDQFLASALQAKHNRLVTEGQIAASRNLDELTRAVAALAVEVAKLKERVGGE
jgi:hypothetical protein